MPVQLSMEEAHLLISRGLAVLVKNTNLEKPPSHAERERVDKYSDHVYQQQIELAMAQRRAEITQYAENIVAGRTKKSTGQHASKKSKRKRRKEGSAEASEEAPGSSTDHAEAEVPDVEAQKAAIIADVMKKCVSTPSRDVTLAPVLLECPRTKVGDLMPAELNYPTSEAQRVRCRVFQDLWEKGHYMTVGSKFGGDFLIYSGDPLVFHAYAVVVCLEKDTSVAGRDFIMWGRLGNAVHKTIVLATVRDDRVHYLSLRWSGEL
uniref:tRNA-intron lyase n=1 Tax=Amblyomma aureolatum TaxID=187763 RepID=A0A1E1XBW7_9ACAR